MVSRKIFDSLGYHVTFDRDHPRSRHNGYVADHILVAETVNGGPLHKGAIVHHKDEDKTNNSPDNIVICKDRAHHILLHLEIKALKASGNKDYRKCGLCGLWDDQANLYRNPANRSYFHRKCRADEAKRRLRAAKEAAQ